MMLSRVVCGRERCLTYICSSVGHMYSSICVRGTCLILSSVVGPHSFSYYYVCVLILLCMCPHTTMYVSSYYYMCPHTTRYAFAYCFMCPLEHAEGRRKICSSRAHRSMRTLGIAAHVQQYIRISALYTDTYVYQRCMRTRVCRHACGRWV